MGWLYFENKIIFEANLLLYAQKYDSKFAFLLIEGRSKISDFAVELFMRLVIELKRPLRFYFVGVRC